jgi:drug/metabolite transporter (DMT)-like permease
VKPIRDPDRNTILGLCAILLWSMTVALARSISERVGPLSAGAAVYLTAGGLLGVHLVWKDRSLRALRALSRRYVVGCGALFVLYTLTLFLALGLASDRLQTIEVGLLNYLWPALTILFALLLLGHRAGLGLIPGTLLAVCGVVLVLTQSAADTWESFRANLWRNPVAYGLGIFAAISWALYSNLTRRWGGSDSRGGVLLFSLATGMAFGLLRLFHPEDGSWDIRVATEVALLSLATGLAYVFWDLAMREGDMVLVASCSYLTPFFSTVVSCMYLRVQPGLSLWAGCALIIAGSFLSWRSIRPAWGEKSPRNGCGECRA